MINGKGLMFALDQIGMLAETSSDALDVQAQRIAELEAELHEAQLENEALRADSTTQQRPD